MSPEELRRLRELDADILNFAYHEQYDAMEQATEELLALASELHQKYGSLPMLLATRASHVHSESEREALLRETYTRAESAGDVEYRAWAAISLASHYVDGMRDMTEGELWVSRAEACTQACGDERVAETIERLRGILNARRRRADIRGSQGRRTRS
jgi:hypothetical protein